VKTKLIISVSIFLNFLSFFSVFAQVKDNGTLPAKKKVIVLNEDHVNYNSIKLERSTILKTHPFGFYIGWQPVELEQQINDYFSLQAGVGVTFKSNLNYLDLSPFSKDPPFIYYSDSKNWVIDIIDNYEDDSGHRQTKPGYIFSFSSRLYLANDGIDNWYLAPSLILSSNNYQVQAVEKNNENIVYQNDFSEKEKLNFTDIIIRLGKQYKKGKFFYEYFVGGGKRFASSHRVDLGYNSNGFVDQKFVDLKTSEWRVESGIRIGLKLF